MEVATEDLVKSFGTQAVLRGVTLKIRRGELVAIVGGSGCGKTVLLKHMIGYLRPDSGRVFVADHGHPGSPLTDLATLSDRQMDGLRVHWGVVFQRNALLTGDVFYNLALWPREIRDMTDEQIMPVARQALTDVGLDPDQVLRRSRDALSGGMAKRLAIARVLVMDPALLFYDEPTAGLDPEMCNTIHDLIDATHTRTPASGIARTSIVVTHDMQMLRRLAPRVVMLAEGSVYFDGTFEQFVARDDPHIRPYVQQMEALHARPVDPAHI